mmetsp:Transcript_23365/g.55315  ORF Transcript_23365/g.55315 Transcript_23365/m.55315 type:complete len:86 (+) Transcript_23365:2293-2550(+)
MDRASDDGDDAKRNGTAQRTDGETERDLGADADPPRSRSILDPDRDGRSRRASEHIRWESRSPLSSSRHFRKKKKNGSEAFSVLR